MSAAARPPEGGAPVPPGGTGEAEGAPSLAAARPPEGGAPVPPGGTGEAEGARARSRAALLAGAAALVAGCVSNSGVAPLGHGYLMVSRQSPAALIDPAKLKAETLREAEAHCTERSRALEVLRVIETGPPQVLVSRVEVQFTCK